VFGSEGYTVLPGCAIGVRWSVTVIAAGIGAASQQPALARRLIEFLASPAAVAAIRKSALEPVGERR
jgi:hypothetical protein